MTRIDPYWIVKQAKTTEIFQDPSEYASPGKPFYYRTARDTYTAQELPFFNRNLVQLPVGVNVHLSEFGFPVLGGLIGAYTGKGIRNKIKNGLLGLLVGAGVYNIGLLSGLRDRFFDAVTDPSKPFTQVGQRETYVDRNPTDEEWTKYEEQSNGDPNFRLKIND